MKKLLKTAFLKSLPVMAGYVVLGIGFGILAVKNGISIWWAAAMSVFIYAGSMQYMAVSLLTSGAGVISVALTTLMVNARHLFYSFSMLRPYKHTGRKKPYLIFGLTDETYSLVYKGRAPEEDLSFRKYAFWVTLMNQSYWVLGTLLGALIGELISFNTAGIDFAMTALFITVFVEQWKDTKDHVPALVGVSVTVACLLLYGTNGFLIRSMLIISLILALRVLGGKRRG